MQRQWKMVSGGPPGGELAAKTEAQAFLTSGLYSPG